MYIRSWSLWLTCSNKRYLQHKRNLRSKQFHLFSNISIHNKDYGNFAKSIFSAAEFLTEKTGYNQNVHHIKQEY